MDAFARKAAMGRNDISPGTMFGNSKAKPGGPKMFPPMDDVADRLHALEDTNKLLQNELQKSEEQGRIDKQQLDLLNNEQKELQDRLKHEKEKLSNRLEKMSEKYANETQQLRQENDFFRDKLESQKEMVQKNERKMAEVMEENRDLGMIKKDMLMNHMAELESLHDKLNQANKRVEEQNKILSVSRTERESKENVYHDEIIQLKKDNDAFIKEIQNQRVLIDQLETQNKEVTQRMKEVTAQKDSLQEEYDTNIAIERSSCTGEKEKHEQELRELEEKYTSKMQEDRDRFEQTLEDEMNRIKKEYKDEQLKDRDHFENTLEAEINRIKKESNDQQVKDRELFETTLEREISRMKEEGEEEKRRYMSDFDSRETDYDVKLRTAHEQDAERSKELHDLRQALSSQEKDLNERMKNELKKRDEEIRKLNECRMEMDRRISEKDQALVDKDKEMQHMKGKFQEALRQSEEKCRRCGSAAKNEKAKMRSVRVQTEEKSQHPKPVRVFMAKWSYNPKTSSPNEFPETELPFRAGDYILMEEKVTEDGWFKGRLLTGEEGYVPIPFVEKVAEYIPPNYKHLFNLKQ